tara:strand:+ start:421 stop:921 length:501 start_codon:yes stop_codon:yes gene_type:complete
LKVKIIALITLLLLFSCKTAQQHIELAKKHTTKAESKGAVITTKTDTLILSNIISDTITLRDTTFITNTIEKTIIETGEIRYITRVDKRKENQLKKRIYKDSITIAKLVIRKNAKVGVSTKKQEEKTERIKVRRESRRSNWLIWIIVGYLLNFAVRIGLKRINNII